MFVCLLGDLFSIPEKSNRFLRWLQSLAAYSRNTRKRLLPSVAGTQHSNDPVHKRIGWRFTEYIPLTMLGRPA